MPSLPLILPPMLTLVCQLISLPTPKDAAADVNKTAADNIPPTAEQVKMEADAVLKPKAAD